MSEIELKPCPFCGGEAGHEHLENGRRSVGCQREECIAFISTTTFATLREAITAWNTRSQSERVSRLEEALKELLDRVDRMDMDSTDIAHFHQAHECARSALNQGGGNG